MLNSGESSYASIALMLNSGESSYASIALMLNSGESSYASIALMLNSGESSYASIALMLNSGESSYLFTSISTAAMLPSRSPKFSPLPWRSEGLEVRGPDFAPLNLTGRGTCHKPWHEKCALPNCQAHMPWHARAEDMPAW